MAARNRRSILAAALLLSLLLLSAGAWVLHEPAPAPVVRRPAVGALGPASNVVVVIGCTVRADQTTPYGGPARTTPFLDAVARDGTRFARAIAQAPWTRPAVTAIVTGRHPLAVGITEPGAGMNNRMLPDRENTLAELMAASGRRTLGLTANPNAGARYAFDQGFDRYWDGDLLFRDGARKLEGGALVAQALDWVGEGGGPFYLQLLLIDAHQPDDAGLGALLFLRPGVPRKVAGYRAMLRRLDGHLRVLSDGLAALGHADDTLLVVVGDHGEGLSTPPHHGRGHGNYLYPSSLHVPLVVRGPGVARGHVVQGVAAQVDVLPTVLGALGLPIPADVHGSDLSAALAGGDLPERAIYADTWFRSARRAAIYGQRRFCQRDLDPRSHEAPAERRPGRPRFADTCFDWDVDPGATAPVEDAVMLGAVEVWQQRLLAERARGGEAPEAQAPELEDALRALGYLEDDGAHDP